MTLPGANLRTQSFPGTALARPERSPYFHLPVLVKFHELGQNVNDGIPSSALPVPGNAHELSQNVKHTMAEPVLIALPGVNLRTQIFPGTALVRPISMYLVTPMNQAKM
jgi:hypothetical protein